MIEKIYDVATGETTEVPYNAKQKAEVAKNDLLIQEREQQKIADSVAKAALLTRLGITDEEAKLLLS